MALATSSRPPTPNAAQDDGHQEHAADAGGDSHYPAAAHVAGGVFGGEAAQGQAGEADGEVGEQQGDSNDVGIHQRVGGRCNHHYDHAADEGIAYHIQRNVVARNGGTAPPQGQHDQRGESQRSYGVDVSGQHPADGKPAQAQTDASQRQNGHGAQNEADDSAQVEGEPNGLDVPGKDERPAHRHGGDPQRDGGIGQADGVGEQPTAQE